MGSPTLGSVKFEDLRTIVVDLASIMSEIPCNDLSWCCCTSANQQILVRMHHPDRESIAASEALNPKGMSQEASLEDPGRKRIAPQ